MQTLPSVSLYIRITEPNGKRRYERVKRGRNPQMCGPHDVYCLHFYEGGKRKWEAVGTDLEAAVTARFKKESDLAVRSKEAAVQPKPSPTAPKSLEELRTAFIHDKKTTFKKDGFPLDPDTCYEKVTREFLDIIKRTLPGEITRQDLRDWIAKQRERISHRTVCNLYVSIVCFLHFSGVDRKKLLPHRANGTRVPDTSLSGHFAAAGPVLMSYRWRQGTSESGDKAQDSLVHAPRRQSNLREFWAYTPFYETDRTPVQQARGLTILGDLREAVAIWEAGTRWPRPLEADVGSAISSLILAAEQGDRPAAEALFAALYSELHRLAKRELARRGSQVSLSATTLLHEAYLDMAARDGPSFPDRARFMGYAARVMRGLIIDHARERHAQKHGGLFEITSLDTEAVQNAVDHRELVRISGTLDELGKVEPALAEIVDLKFFCGFSFAEIAAMRDVSERTVQRNWEKARIYLHRTIRADLSL